jgi:hypothetical protein
MQGEIDMNVSVAAAILILKLKDNEDFKLPILGYRIKKKRKTQNYEKNYCSDNSNHDISFFRTNGTASGCFSEQNLNRI